MPYLIDGHNLIGQLPDLDFDDPDDEAKLVLKLRGFAARLGKKMTVIFDHGIPGEVSRDLSTHSVKVQFASTRSSADNLIRSKIQTLKNPPGWILITSDTEIRGLAESRGMKCVWAHEFARQMNIAPTDEDKGQRPDPNKTNPRLSKEEVEEWLQLFDSKDDEF